MNDGARAFGRTLMMMGAAAGRAGARRELGGGVRQHPGSTTALRGAYGIARFDRREPVESDEHARSTCGVRELRQPPVRRSVGQRAAAARRPPALVCWWRWVVGGERAMLAAPRIGAARPRRRALATTGHRAAACDQHDTRRHTATSVSSQDGGRGARRGTGSWKTGGIETTALIVPVNHTRADSSRVRVREAV